jgi:hypothetical protein
MADRWFALLVMTRLLGAGVAIALLAAHRVTAHDELLMALVVFYTGVSLGGLHAAPGLRGSRALWVLDAVAGLALIWWSGDWRSPFYVLALTTLVLPVTTLRFRSGVAWGIAFAASYGAVGVLTERLGTSTFQDTIRLETAATHLMVPVLVSIALAYASDLLARLAAERERAERLAVQAERQRIAWELTTPPSSGCTPRTSSSAACRPGPTTAREISWRTPRRAACRGRRHGHERGGAADAARRPPGRRAGAPPRRGAGRGLARGHRGRRIPAAAAAERRRPQLPDRRRGPHERRAPRRRADDLRAHGSRSRLRSR